MLKFCQKEQKHRKLKLKGFKTIENSPKFGQVISSFSNDKIKPNSMDKVSMNYRRTGIGEQFRIVFRVIDLVLLLIKVTRSGQSFLKLKELILVELGPGPTRLSFFKSLLFRKVIYIDMMDYSIDSSSLVICDLSKGIPLPVELLKFPDGDENIKTLYMGDHCLEHLPFDIVLDFFRNYEGSFIFRVPNVRSFSGLEDFRRDATHLTAFDNQQLDKIKSVGKISLMFWTRFYSMGLGSLFHRKALDAYSRELCIYEIQI